MQKIRKRKGVNLYLGKHKKDLRLNWTQAKKKYPNLKPDGDSDFDGTLNSRDCKPLNPGQDGIFGRIVGAITGDKYGQSKKEYAAERTAKKRVRTEVTAKGLKETLKKRKWHKYLPPEEKFKAVKKEYKKQRFKARLQRFKARVEKVEKKVERVKAVARKTVTGSSTGKVFKRGAAKIQKGYTIGGVSYRPRALTKGKEERKTHKGQSPKGPGRPKQTFKLRINPLTGQQIRIPATEFYKLQKKARQIQEARATGMAERTDVVQTQQLARRGIPPEIARQIVDRRQIQRELPPPPQIQREELPPPQIQPQQPQQYPQQQYPQQQPHFQQQQRFRTVTDIMTGRIIIKSRPPRERWTMN